MLPEWIDSFTSHELNPSGTEKSRMIAAIFITFYEELESVCGKDGRAMAICRTKLEEASFFAKKAMATRPINQLKPSEERLDTDTQTGKLDNG